MYRINPKRSDLQAHTKLLSCLVEVLQLTYGCSETSNMATRLRSSCLKDLCLRLLFKLCYERSRCHALRLVLQQGRSGLRWLTVSLSILICCCADTNRDWRGTCQFSQRIPADLDTHSSGTMHGVGKWRQLDIICCRQVAICRSQRTGHG